jgi:antitoxin (DNA-binding transcriptional repressor) of toxin-antitoxin stability system
MTENMTILHITETELASDVPAVLDRVRKGAEVVLERNAQPMAVSRSKQSASGTTGHGTSFVKFRK